MSEIETKSHTLYQCLDCFHVWRYGDHPDDEWLEDQKPDPFARPASHDERAMMQALNRRVGAACPACNVCAGSPVENVRRRLEEGLEINQGSETFEAYFRSALEKAAANLERYLADNPSEDWPLEV